MEYIVASFDCIISVALTFLASSIIACRNINSETAINRPPVPFYDCSKTWPSSTTKIRSMEVDYLYKICPCWYSMISPDK